MDRKKFDDEDWLEYKAWCRVLAREEATELKAKAHFKKLKRGRKYALGSNIGCRREKVLMGNKQFHVLGPADRVYSGHYRHFPQCQCRKIYSKHNLGESTLIKDAWTPVVKIWRTV